MIESERIPYLKTLMYIAASDDDIADEEVEFFVDAGSSYGISHSEVLSIKNEVVDNDESLEEIVSGITEDETKMELLSVVETFLEEEVIKICIHYMLILWVCLVQQLML